MAISSFFFSQYVANLGDFFPQKSFVEEAAFFLFFLSSGEILPK